MKVKKKMPGIGITQQRFPNLPKSRKYLENFKRLFSSILKKLKMQKGESTEENTTTF